MKPDNRRGDLAAMHIAQKTLGLSTEDASALKLAITGQASAATMSARQRQKYLTHLSGLQARNSASSSERAPVQRSINDRQDVRWTKARLLWSLLAQAGHIRANTDAALMAYVKRQTHVEYWRFLNQTQINTVIESLKRWCLRANVVIH